MHIHVRDPETGRPSSDLGLFREVLTAIKRALRRDHPADHRRRSGDDDRGARGGADRVPAGDGDVQRRLDQLRPVPDRRARPRLGRVGARVPRGHARLRVPQHVRRHGAASAGWSASPRSSPSSRPTTSATSTTSRTCWTGAARHAGAHPVRARRARAPTSRRSSRRRTCCARRRALFGEDFTWSAAGVGYPEEYHLAALGIMIGGQLRVGLEDNLRVSRSKRRRVQRRAGREGREAGGALRPRARDTGRGARVLRPQGARRGRVLSGGSSPSSSASAA